MLYFYSKTYDMQDKKENNAKFDIKPTLLANSDESHYQKVDAQ